MANNFVRLTVLLTLVGIFLFVWIPVVESKGGRGGGGRGFGGRGSSFSSSSRGRSVSSSRSGGISSGRSKISSSISKRLPKISPKKVIKKIGKSLPKRIPSRVVKTFPKSIPKKMPRKTPNKSTNKLLKKILKKIPKKLPKHSSLGSNSIKKSSKLSSTLKTLKKLEKKAFKKGYKKGLKRGKYRKSKGSKKSFAKKHWKKAAAFGVGAAGAYLGYQGYKKLRDAFQESGGSGFNEPQYIDGSMIDSHAVPMMSGDDYNEPYSFASWDRNARKDGWVCRSDEDCEWLDPHLGCDDNEFEMRNVQGDWPWKKDLTGRCSCEIGYYFDDNTGSCTSNGVPEDELYYNYVTNSVPEYELDYYPMTEYSEEDIDSIIQSGIIEHMVYGEGKDDKIKSTYESNIKVEPDVDYFMQIEVLRNDLGDNGERVSKITIDGVNVGDCDPDGGDYDCTFFDCKDSLEYQIVSSINGSLSVGFTYEGHSWDCDCDKKTWSCSKESTVSGRTPMTAVARITLTPYLQDSEPWSNGDVKLEEDGTPLIFWDSQWIPICGHYFWDNQLGAELFCREMGFESGLFSGRGSGQKYEGDSFRIGKCEHGDTWESCSGGCNDYRRGGSCNNNANAKCDKNQAVKFTIKCSGGDDIKTSTRGGKDTCFVVGDGGGGREKKLGLAANREECAELVKIREPNANGATFSNSAGPGNCFAEFQMSRVNANKKYQTCLFSEESYQYIEKGCVNGHNLVLYKDISVEECKKKCNMKQDCLAFEYGVAYGGSGNYEPHDCNLQSSGNYANCNGAHHNLDLYVKTSKKN